MNILQQNKSCRSTVPEQTPDVKIGVIGFAEDYGASVGYKKFEALGYSITEDYDEVDRLAEELEEEKGCDATILLAHGAADRIAERQGPVPCLTCLRRCRSAPAPDT